MALIEHEWSVYEDAECIILKAAQRQRVELSEILRVLREGEFVRRRVTDLIAASVLGVPIKQIDENLFKSRERSRDVVNALIGSGLPLPIGLSEMLCDVLLSVDDGPALAPFLKRSSHRPRVRLDESYALEAVTWIELLLSLKQKEYNAVDFIADKWCVGTGTIRRWRIEIRRSHRDALNSMIDFRRETSAGRLTVEIIKQIIIAQGEDRRRLISREFHV